MGQKSEHIPALLQPGFRCAVMLPTCRGFVMVVVGFRGRLRGGLQLRQHTSDDVPSARGPKSYHPWKVTQRCLQPC